MDDEVHNLSSFKASFRRSFDVHLANSAAEALEKLEHVNPHVIISDQRMPGTTGIELFEKIKESYPFPVRVLLTAYTNSQTVIDAVNKGRIDHYLLKPWSSEIMTATIDSGYKLYQTRIDLRDKNEELKKTNSELNRFVYSVSHDLRAPLMSILGLINLARIEQVEDERTQYFDLMEKSVSKMDNYIQTTLEYYRNFRAEINYEMVDVNHLITDIIDSLQSSNPKVKFKFEFEGDSKVLTDLMRLKISCGNLISNAVKYGRKESDEYEIRITAKNTPTHFILEVSDDGIGIPDNDLPHIFDIFYKGSGHTHKKSTGLGLYLVKEAINRINGKIEVKSRHGEGSTFTVKIPHRHTLSN